MAKKLKSDPIGQDDLIEFIDGHSDFAFELRCLERLSRMEFRCEHAGFYTDPVTGKMRQFDIRARKGMNGRLILCAIECKNLSEGFPLLVICTPRSQIESFHDLITSYHPNFVDQGNMSVRAFEKICEQTRIGPGQSPYRMGEAVGKSWQQVGRDEKGNLVTSDSELFEKWSQAVASAQDLLDEATKVGMQNRLEIATLVLPVLVVPDGALWEVQFESDGTRKTKPIQTNRCSFFLGRECRAGDNLQGIDFTLSHLEFVTFTGLKELLTEIKAEDRLRPKWFRQ